jgi:DNA processing protein
VDAKEIHARTAWGLLAEPGDSRIHRWISAQGPVEALARLCGPDSPHTIASGLASLMDPDEDLVDAIVHWRAQYLPTRIQSALALSSQRELHLLSATDPHWPTGLNDLGDYAPHTVWIAGNPALATSVTPWVAIVGARGASAAGVAAARALTGSHWASQVGIVSGGARGIDTAVHMAALERKLPTIAVMAGGLDSLYPAHNAVLFQRIVTEGALLSESPCTERALPHRFLGRNRLIAALAGAVIVVEAAARSGALNTAGHAAALGRPTGVVPGRWGDVQSAGCWRIVRERRGIVLTEPDDGYLLLEKFQPAPA